MNQAVLALTNKLQEKHHHERQKRRWTKVDIKLADVVAAVFSDEPSQRMTSTCAKEFRRRNATILKEQTDLLFSMEQYRPSRAQRNLRRNAVVVHKEN